MIKIITENDVFFFFCQLNLRLWPRLDMFTFVGLMFARWTSLKPYKRLRRAASYCKTTKYRRPEGRQSERKCSCSLFPPCFECSPRVHVWKNKTMNDLSGLIKVCSQVQIILGWKLLVTTRHPLPDGTVITRTFNSSLETFLRMRTLWSWTKIVLATLL